MTWDIRPSCDSIRLRTVNFETGDGDFVTIDGALSFSGASAFDMTVSTPLTVTFESDGNTSEGEFTLAWNCRMFPGI